MKAKGKTASQTNRALNSPLRPKRGKTSVADQGNAAAAAAALITSSTKKVKPVPTTPLRRSTRKLKELRDSSQVNSSEEDARQDLRLAFPSLSTCENGISSTSTAIFSSPVFHVSTSASPTDLPDEEITVNPVEDASTERVVLDATDSSFADENIDPGSISHQMDTSETGVSLCQAKQDLTYVDELDNVDNEAMVDDDYDELDPYLFIKRLPDLSAVASTSRCTALLPKQTRRCPPITLVLDLDETLVHSTTEYCHDADFTFPVNFNSMEYTVYVKCRPHLQMFMERVAQLFEIIVFTASQSVYAEQLLSILDPKRKLIRHRVFRDSCVLVDGNYLKDLTILGRDLSKTVIVDNSPQAFGFQIDNGIPIESWFDDKSDSELPGLLPFLETLVGVDDVRPIIAKKFNLRQKIAAAREPSFMNRGRHVIHL